MTVTVGLVTTITMSLHKEERRAVRCVVTTEVLYLHSLVGYDGQISTSSLAVLPALVPVQPGSGEEVAGALIVQPALLTMVAVRLWKSKNLKLLEYSRAAGHMTE